MITFTEIQLPMRHSSSSLVCFLSVWAGRQCFHAGANRDLLYGGLSQFVLVVAVRLILGCMFAQETCPSVKNILLLDSEGKRVAVKYYTDDWPVLSAKLAFEKSVFVKTQKASSGAEGNPHSALLYF